MASGAQQTSTPGNPNSQQPPQPSVNETGFDALPNEVFTIILEHLYLDADANFTKYALVSQKWKQVVTPILYRSFIFAGPGGVERRHRLLRTLLKNPELGKNMKDLNYENDINNLRAESLGLPCSLSLLARTRFGEAGLWCTALRSDLERGDWDALTGLLLLCTPNLQSLVSLIS